MITLQEASTTHKVPKSTLLKRAYRLGIKGIKRGSAFYYNYSQVMEIVEKPLYNKYPTKRTYISTNLIKTFKLLNPSLVAEEIAFALSIDLERVKTALKDEYLTIESKMNK